jgi:hypothetical protein
MCLLQVAGLDVTASHLAVWNGKRVQVRVGPSWL